MINFTAPLIFESLNQAPGARYPDGADYGEEASQIMLVDEPRERRKKT
jgi:hypothetical protein